jgi:hypothetical protein
MHAQTLEVSKPTATGVSEAFKDYSIYNGKQAAAGVDMDDEDEAAEVPNHFYLSPAEASFGMTRSLRSALFSASLAVPAAPSHMNTQTTTGTLPVTPIASYTGLGDGFINWTNQLLLPPDTTMAVGNNQIVQWVNVRLTILNKTTGANLLLGGGGIGYINGNQIWSGLAASNPASLCATTNRGDPVLQYDRLAGRWFLSQFAFNGNGAAPPYAMCFAVSQTSDATGAYNLYEYSIPNLPDYPKIGVWPDAYYWTANDYTNLSYVGSRICAVDRAAMIAGNAASNLCFVGLSAAHFASLPADFEGTNLPPAGTDEYIISNDWFTKNAPPYFMQLRRFHPDFVTPGNSTLNDGFGGAPDSFVSLPFDNSVIGSCNDGGGACVQQPGTTRRLDTLSMRAMYRLAYRNLGAPGASLMFTQSIQPTSGPAHPAGIHLVEIRNPSANPPVIYNNVNYNPDATNRWMGATASDKLGNIAVGYSVSSSTKSPSIRVAGRQRNDIKSTLRGEVELKTGTAQQVASGQRWGDYSTMQIDPDDDCTFWYTTEYTTANTPTLANWATQIVSFKFNNCQ